VGLPGVTVGGVKVEVPICGGLAAGAARIGGAVGCFRVLPAAGARASLGRTTG
jgi:hypothetical protein